MEGLGLLQKQPNEVSFMTTLDREMFPTSMPRNRFGNEIVPLRGAPHRGPGCYENEDKTSFWYDIEHKINSTKGYTLGARTGSRFRKENVYQTPSPTAYQTNCTDELLFEKSNKPFLVGADRFPVYRRDLTEVLPGPGAYEHDLRRNKKVQWHQSFGGSPISMPQTKVRSIIDQNTNKLYSTKEENKYNRKLAYLKLFY